MQDAGFNPEYIHQGRNWERWLSDHSIFVRFSKDMKVASSSDPETQYYIDSELPIERHIHQKWAIDITSSSEKSGTDWNRVDDLIIRLIFMIKGAVPFFGDEDEVWYS